MAPQKRKPSLAEEVFGAIKRPRATGDYYVDLRVASTPLFSEDATIRACCTGCGLCIELAETGALGLAKMARVQKPEKWSDYYFEVNRCDFCDKDFSNVVLKKISDLRE